MNESKKASMAPSDLSSVYQALNRVQAIIEFELDGTVISANENFLRMFGYDLDEIVGKHHRVFCEPSYAESPEYGAFWRKLGKGEYDAAKFKRLAKGGEEIWLRASYNPIFDKDGTLVDFHATWDPATGAGLRAATSDEATLQAAADAIGYDLETNTIRADSIFIAETNDVIFAALEPHVDIGEFGDALLQCSEIEHGTASQQRNSVRFSDLPHFGQGIVPKTAGRVSFCRITDIDQAMRCLRQGCSIRLGTADIHAAIHHRRVDTDDIHR